MCRSYQRPEQKIHRLKRRHEQASGQAKPHLTCSADFRRCFDSGSLIHGVQPWLICSSPYAPAW